VQLQEKSVVLIVDDEPVNIQVLAACLKNKYQIKVATSGQQCIELIQSGLEIDLILLDIDMPDMDGYEVCTILKSSMPTSLIPIIFVTAKSETHEEEKGLELGAVDYITKPISPAIVAARVNTHVTLKLQHDKMQQMAMHDQLTGLYNRYFLLADALHKVSKSKRHNYHLSTLMIDIDHFKAINDNHGHAVGDDVLKAVADCLFSQKRAEDILARFGGEEFVLLLDHCVLAEAELKAEKLRVAIEALKPSGLKITISIGVAQLKLEETNFTDPLKRADDALYVAKEQGRNRVVTCDQNRTTTDSCISFRL
jgi:diguanylate cyclase (GGDEF)-like protein